MDIIEKDLTKFSTIRTESHAKYFCSPQNIEDLKQAIEFKFTKNIDYVILGNGSNILFSKKKYNDILFIKLAGNFNSFELNKSCARIGGAYSLKIAGKKLIKNGFSDYIFFNLIPACIGGAITQNAGTGANEEIKDVCLSVKLFDIICGEIVELTNNECLFDYRDSIIKKVPNQYIVLSADFSIRNKTDNVENLILETKERISEKINREPSGYSFGSTFMNAKMPAWECVKKIREKLNSNRGAFYSDKHNNWIVNKTANGQDIAHLIKETQKLVKEDLNIDLINEVKIIK
jgi:UDP-N-acetylmuramate dehydrogenase